MASDTSVQVLAKQLHGEYTLRIKAESDSSSSTRKYQAIKMHLEVLLNTPLGFCIILLVTYVTNCVGIAK